jgi:putative hemolysin
MRISTCSFNRGVTALLLSLSIFVAACGGPPQADQPGRVQVDAVTIQILESFPVQVNALITGSLLDGCTVIDRVDHRFDAEEGIFWLEVITAHTEDDACTQALVPFQETVSLDVYGLPAGTYIVDVNGVRETFKLDVDNALPDAELPNPASLYCQEQGHVLEIHTDEQGNQVGVCIFPDGSECDEWAFFRGECGPAD